jgi:RNA polymerase sigma-70 factor (ECF subfamily)
VPAEIVADDADDVRLARAGDADAFERLYHAHAPRTFALCLRLSGDRQLAAEYTQDAFIRAWEQLRSFRGESAFSTWLHRLTVNVVLNGHRATQRRARLESQDEEDDLDVIPMPRASVPGDRLDLETAIATLGPRARTVFVLHQIEGYSFDEIADQFGISAVTVRTHLMRARRRLMEILDP